MPLNATCPNSCNRSHTGIWEAPTALTSGLSTNEKLKGADELAPQIREDLVQLGHIALNPKIREELTAAAEKLKSEDKLLSDRQLNRTRKRFGRSSDRTS
jgi:hypothetical protein